MNKMTTTEASIYLIKKIAHDLTFRANDLTESGQCSEAAFEVVNTILDEAIKQLRMTARSELERSIAQKVTDNTSMVDLMSLYYDDQIGHLSGLSDEELMEEKLMREELYHE